MAEETGNTAAEATPTTDSEIAAYLVKPVEADTSPDAGKTKPAPKGQAADDTGKGEDGAKPTKAKAPEPEKKPTDEEAADIIDPAKKPAEDGADPDEGEADPDDGDTGDEPEDGDGEEQGEDEGDELDVKLLLEVNPTIPVTIDGKTVDVPLAELTQGYSRQSDYTQKTQVLAQREQIAQNAVNDASRIAQWAHQTVAPMIEQLQMLVEFSEPDVALYHQDPEEYFAKRMANDQLRQRLSEAQQVQQQAKQDHDAYLAHVQGQWRQGEYAKLTQMFPTEFASKETAKAFEDKVYAYLDTKSFTPQERAQLEDHRMVAIVADAMAWRDHTAKQQEQKPLAHKRVKGLPKVVTPGKKPSKGDEKRDRVARLRRQLDKSAESGGRNAQQRRDNDTAAVNFILET